MNFIAKKIAKARTQGLLRTLEVQFNDYVPPWVFRYSMGDIYDLDAESLKSLAPKDDLDDGLVVRSLDPDSNIGDRMRLREFTWNSVPIETTTNDIGYGVYDANDPNKLLAGVWAGSESFLENNLGVKFSFTGEQAWLYCAFVDTSARGRGVYKKLISFAAADLQQRGFTQLLGIVQPWNRISRIMHEKHSRGVIGRMSAVRIGSLVWVTSAGNISADRQLVTAPATNPTTVTISKELWKRQGRIQESTQRSPGFATNKMAKPL